MANNRNSGRLLHGNPGGDPSKAPRCGAKTRRGTPCNAPAMRSTKTGDYTRCRLHGGASTGPRLPPAWSDGVARDGKLGPPIQCVRSQRDRVEAKKNEQQFAPSS